VRELWSRVRGLVAQLTRTIPAAALAAALFAVAMPAFAQTKPPSAPKRVNVKDLQPAELAPATNLHTEFIVEVNKFGQVTRVRSGKSSKNASFNAMTYGNALQAFIRTPDNHVVVGTYRLSYDYQYNKANPKESKVHREVALVRTGGVNPNALGAVTEMEGKIRPHTPLPAHPAPAPSVNIQRLPDLPQVMKSPSH
jgi:hypothetical protein